jgi:cob(I)alamin adenosyltransferase
MLPEGHEYDMVERIQNCLFNVCTNLATDQSQTPLYPSALLPEGEIELMEKEVDTITQLLPEKQGFILSGGTPAAAQAHVCRTVCRRAERRIVALSEEAVVSPEILQYVNRLSDYLFVLAKKLNFIEGKSEKVWQNVCK